MNKNNGSLLLFACIGITVFLFVITTNNQPDTLIRPLSNASHDIYFNLYALDPHFFSPFDEYSYPFVQHTPKTSRYALVLLSEKNDKRTNKYDDIFLASKRISELEKWGSDMEITAHYQNVNALKQWWAEKKPNIYNLPQYNRYYSWEATVARYIEHIENTLNTIAISDDTLAPLLDNSESKLSKLATLKKTLKTHHLKLDWIIENSQKSPENKTYLTSMVNDAFEYFATITDQHIRPYDGQTIEYHLFDIHESQQSGIYKPYLVPVYTTIIGEPVIDYENKIYNLSEVIPISKTSANKLYLKIPQKNILDSSIWMQGWNKTNTDYKYYTTFNITESNQPYFFSMKMESSQSAIIRLERIVKSKYVPVFEQVIRPHDNQLEFEKNILLTGDNYSLYRVVYISKFAPTTDQFEQAQLSMTPIIIPELVLKKINTLSPQQFEKMEKSTSKRNGFHNSPFRIIFLLSISFITFFFSVRFIKKYYRILKSVTFKHIKKIRHIALYFVIISLVSDIVFLNKFDELFTVLGAICWIVTTIGYKLTTGTHFIIALMLYAFFFIPYTSGSLIMADRIVVWSFIFLLVGTASFFTSVGDDAADLKAFFTFLRGKYINIKYLLNQLIRALKKYIEQHLIYHPQTPRDYMINIARIILMLILFVTIIVTTLLLLFSMHSAVKRYQKKLTRISLNPVINSIEPRIVYQSTNVIIWGRGFEWSDNKAVLKSQYGPITTTLRTDKKIIFTVPLHFKPGPLKLWIEKPIQWNGKNTTAKSNIFEIKLIPRSQSFTNDDDEYFEQLKTLDPEVLTINGYK